MGVGLILIEGVQRRCYNVESLQNGTGLWTFHSIGIERVFQQVVQERVDSLRCLVAACSVSVGFVWEGFFSFFFFLGGGEGGLGFGVCGSGR